MACAPPVGPRTTHTHTPSPFEQPIILSRNMTTLDCSRRRGAGQELCPPTPPTAPSGPHAAAKPQAQPAQLRRHSRGPHLCTSDAGLRRIRQRAQEPLKGGSPCLTWLARRETTLQGGRSSANSRINATSRCTWPAVASAGRFVALRLRPTRAAQGRRGGKAAAARSPSAHLLTAIDRFLCCAA